MLFSERPQGMRTCKQRCSVYTNSGASSRALPGAGLERGSLGEGFHPGLGHAGSLCPCDEEKSFSHWGLCFSQGESGRTQTEGSPHGLTSGALFLLVPGSASPTHCGVRTHIVLFPKNRALCQ